MILELEDIHCFYGLSHVLHGVTLQVDAGEIVSLLGRNGAGKTTTISSIVGLVPPRSGEIRLDGVSIAGKPTFEISRAGIGWVPQGRRLFPELTVQENIHLATLKLRRDGDGKGIARVYDIFPRLREREGTLARNLSGGEQQMLAIARALVGQPHVLLLDEPTEGLSPKVISDIMSVIREFAAAGAAVLLAEQNVRVALSTAHRHYIMNHGEVIFASTTDELNRREDIVADYLGVKAKSRRPAP